MGTAGVHAQDNTEHPPARYVIGSTKDDAERYAAEAGHTKAKCIPIHLAFDPGVIKPGDVVIAVKHPTDRSQLWAMLPQTGAIVKGR